MTGVLMQTIPLTEKEFHDVLKKMQIEIENQDMVFTTMKYQEDMDSEREI